MESGSNPSELNNPSTQPTPSTLSETKKTSRIRSQWNRLASSRIGQGARFTYTWRRPILFGVGVSVFISRYYYSKYQAAKRDFIHPDTYLVWRLYDGAVVEYPSNQTNLNMLLGSSSEGSEPPRVMTLYDAVRTLQFIQSDDRIIGLIADMSSTNAPNVSQNAPLGLAQIEELQEALNELKVEKEKRLGVGKFKTIAFTETFKSQAEYAMASGFDEIYCQPSGEIPLVGINSTVTFYSRLLNWLGIKVHAEARTDYKSMVAPYTQEQFTTPQAENHSELLEDLNRNMLSLIAVNRFRKELTEHQSRDPKEMGKLTDRMKSYSQKGPLMTHEAIEMGLITGTTYKDELFEKVMFGKDAVVIDELGEVLKGVEKINAIKDEIKLKTKGFFHYHRIMDRISQRRFKEDILNVGVVYVLGTIGDVGEFGTGAIVKGLKEAAEDDSVGAVVLRIDSGGGGVVESDTIWGAVKELRSRGKPVIASFGNAAASGGYLIATHTDGIFAMPSTITGSIGVASLRPTIMPSFFERLKLTTQSFFTGSKALSMYHELGEEALSRHKTHIDLAYEDFKARVCDGRQISNELIEKLAGGRVYTGLKAWTLAEDSHREVTEQKLQSEPIPIEPKQKSDVNPISSVDAVTNLDSAQHQPDISIKHPTSLIPPDNELLASSSDQLPVGSTSSETSELQNGELTRPGGPLGRGIIDGIGGIRDAAIHGVELYLARMLSEKQEKEPTKSPTEILQELLPGVPYKTNEEGHLMMSFDIRLKKFPVHKSFWEQLNAASKRGDGIEVSIGTLSETVKEGLMNWMRKVMLETIESEGLEIFGIRRSL
ncbi:putative protease IV sppA [Melampsora americana]|nr:putative protease IV sppA [Melampsora americana]